MRQLFFDIECYANYFLVMFTTVEGKSKSFEIFGDDVTGFDADRVLDLISRPDVELVSFNGMNYDLPMLTYAIVGASPMELKMASDRIINNNLKHWQFYRRYGLVEPEVNHVDLIEVSPGIVSLKIYGGRLHSPRLQDLPIEPDAMITEEQRDLLKKYCKNDTLVTRDLFKKLEQQIELRRTMSAEYGIDLRSKSDAQIAEAVLKAEYSRVVGREPAKTQIAYKKFYYEPPEYVKFRTETLRSALQTIMQSEMVVDPETGHVKMPKAIADLKIKIGSSVYKLGIGGLHSQESEVCHKADESALLIDRDVASYYPNLILNMGMSPGSFGHYFEKVYRKILVERLEAKHKAKEIGNRISALEKESDVSELRQEQNKYQSEADSKKLSVNGTFGKLANKYSLLYAPKMLIGVTLTGQLSLLMLIEAVERYGISVVSANTDGIVMKCPVEKYEGLNKIIAAWEKHTRLETEETRYSALYSRDVNSYIAITLDGKVKGKGAYGLGDLTKNPQNRICVEAVIKYLTEGKTLTSQIYACDDIRKFLTVRTVKGGAEKDGEMLGKAIRWYYAEGVTGTINYASNGNTVPRTEGAKPLMDLPDTFPDDVDYEWYVRECQEILMSIGAKPRPVVAKIPRKNSKAWKALVEEGKIVEGPKGKYVWAT